MAGKRLIDPELRCACASRQETTLLRHSAPRNAVSDPDPEAVIAMWEWRAVFYVRKASLTVESWWQNSGPLRKSLLDPKKNASVAVTEGRMSYHRGRNYCLFLVSPAFSLVVRRPSDGAATCSTSHEPH